MRKLAKKFIFLKVIGIVSIGNKLFKTVGLLVVRLGLAKLRLKNWKEKSNFWLKCESRIFDEEVDTNIRLKMIFDL